MPLVDYTDMRKEILKVRQLFLLKLDNGIEVCLYIILAVISGKNICTLIKILLLLFYYYYHNHHHHHQTVSEICFLLSDMNSCDIKVIAYFHQNSNKPCLGEGH